MEMIYLIIMFAWICLIIGFWKQDAPLSLLASMLIIAIGVYIIINGILIYKDWFTETLGIIHIAIGGYIFVHGSYELVGEDLFR
jgi:hypothetical protein